MRALLAPLLWLACSFVHAAAGEPAHARMALMGLHGGVQEVLARHAPALGLELQYFSDEQIAGDHVDLSTFDLALIEHVRGEALDHYRKLVVDGKAANPKLVVLGVGDFPERRFADLVKNNAIVSDPKIDPYYCNTDENTRRFLIYVLATYAGRPLTIEPPVEVARNGFYHPDHDGLFPDAAAFLEFARERGIDPAVAPRAAVAVHLEHLFMQQPHVVDALIRAFERHGVLAAGIVDQREEYAAQALEFKPQVVIHTCHSRDDVSFREQLDVPQMHSVFFRAQSIDEWQHSLIGLASNELNLQLVTQELIGAIEPIAAAGTLEGGGSGETFTPIPDRIEHLVARACNWIALQRTPNRDKKVAVVYWDREMGKAELMRGSATGMFLNAPRSILNVLQKMKDAGYSIDPAPRTEDELLGWMMDHGRQIGAWLPGELDRLAKSGLAVLVPVEKYRAWFETRVPEAMRREVIARWGEPPGQFLAWKDEAGHDFIVIPRIDLGNVVMLPQPLRGEAQDLKLVHDQHVPPPHNYLATYFWMQEEFHANAFVHFGTHGSEFLLPGKGTGLSGNDWPDIVIGAVPNIYPWVMNNLGESSGARRRTYAVLIDHLTPPSVAAGLSDELANLHGDLEKWEALEAGALKDRFRNAITRQCREQHLDQDIHVELATDQSMTDAQIDTLQEYLHSIEEDTIPTSPHVLGEPPPEELRMPYLVTCLRKKFLDAIAEVFPDATKGDREANLRAKAEDAIRLVVKNGLAANDALTACGGVIPATGLAKEITDGFELAKRIDAGLLGATAEVDNVLRALDGKFISPAPGSSPDRNPASVPTGRNMYVMNPDEVPTKPSWEIGVKLVDQLLAEQLATKGKLPARVAFSMSPSQTFQDYGVMEAQILYLLGVRPIWDAQNLVNSVELIPTAELKRPRIDVFMAAGARYRDMLPTRMTLLDRAVRLVADLDEPNNLVRANTARIESDLAKRGIDATKAKRFARARLFGSAIGSGGGGGFSYLVERSGEWGSRDDLVGRYMEHAGHAYTEGFWGEEAPEAYRAQLKDSDVVVRNWNDRTRSPLSNKYFWLQGGGLSLAIEHLSGKQPEFFLADVRDPDRGRMVSVEDALREDFRARVFNRKWIEGMMKEGYAGADQIAVHMSNAMGWSVMRKGSVTADQWQEIVDVYLRDKKNLHLKEWFEAENPFAFQDVAETLLEVARKGFWSPDAATLQEIAAAYAQSIALHGEGGGLRGGGNVALEQFVAETLSAPGNRALDALLAAMRAKQAGDAAATDVAAAAAPTARPTVAPAPAPAPAEPIASAKELPPAPTEVVEGTKLEPTVEPPASPMHVGAWCVGLAAVCLVAFGIWRKVGAPT